MLVAQGTRGQSPAAPHFDLPNAIRSILADTGLSDPADIARELLHRIPAAAVPAVLELVLPVYVRQRIVAERALTSPATARGILVRSAKVTGITEWWRQVLEDRVVTSNGYKRLADCTWEDLDYLSGKLRLRADLMVVKAQRYEKLRDLLSRWERGATLGQLPKEVLMDVLGPLPDGSGSVPDPEDDEF